MPPEVAVEVNALLSWLANAAALACLLGALFAAGKIAAAWATSGIAGVQHLFIVLVACLLIGSASAIVGAVV